jgi:hypothetical protein
VATYSQTAVFAAYSLQAALPAQRRIKRDRVGEDEKCQTGSMRRIVSMRVPIAYTCDRFKQVLDNLQYEERLGVRTSCIALINRNERKWVSGKLNDTFALFWLDKR